MIPQWTLNELLFRETLLLGLLVCLFVLVGPLSFPATPLHVLQGLLEPDVFLFETQAARLQLFVSIHKIGILIFELLDSLVAFGAVGGSMSLLLPLRSMR